MNMINGDPEPWKIVVTQDELMNMLTLVMAIGRKETAKTVVWLTRVPNGPRLWIFREGTVVSWLTAPATPSDPVIAVPIPESFVGLLAAGVEDDEQVTLSCNPMDGTLVAHTLTRTIATDLPVDVEFTPLDLPYQHQEDSRHLNPALATVSVRDLGYLAMLSHDIPRGLRLGDNLREEEQLHPFVSIAIGDGKMSWTTDWRRYGMGQTTGTVPARTRGSLTAMFYPYQAARIIGTKDFDEEARIFIDGQNADYIHVVGPGWGIRIHKEFEEVDRWRRTLMNSITAAGYELGGHGRRLSRHKVDFVAHDYPCFATILADDQGKSERIRLSSVVSENVEPTIEVLTLVNDVNATLVGAKVVLWEGQLRIDSEFDAAVLPDIGPHLRLFLNAVIDASPEFDYVPLFLDEPADI